VIAKHSEINKINFKKNNIYLFYGKNESLKKEKINLLAKKFENTQLIKYNQNEILDNSNIFFNEILNNSFFDNQKILLVNQATDKIEKIISELLSYSIIDTLIILNAEILEKKSKLRILFEKNNDLICVPFYPDNNETLINIVYSFLKEKKILLSQSDVNLLINRCNNDRGNIENELNKIEMLSETKKIKPEDIIKIINLYENYEISDLVDNCLAKNHKKTLNIINENNFSSEEVVLIIRIFINKAKKLLYLADNYAANKDLEKTISSSRPPIFWKNKEIIKQQIIKWKSNNIKKLIFDLNNIELQIKKNSLSSINILTNFIIDQSN